VNTLPPGADAALEALARQELARRSLLDFCELVYPGFETPPHIRFVANLLERAERGGVRRLAISLPVRHGKSVLSSQCFTAWYLGRHPRAKIILASHSESLARDNNRTARSLVADDRWPWPDVRLAPDSHSAGLWNTTAGGSSYAVGVGGAITGRGADVLIIDDALHDGLSEAECATAYRWYSEVATPRLEPNAVVICIGARFGSNDLIGQILDAEEGPSWDVVNLPALADVNDPLGRAIGEPLWPERMGAAEIESRRIAMGSFAFEAQFMQRPTPRGGAMFKAEWFKNRYPGGIPPARIVESFGNRLAPNVYESISRRSVPLTIVAGVDTAAAVGVYNDYSVVATVAFDGMDFFIIDISRKRLEFPELVREVINRYQTYHPSRVFIEAASSGIATVQQLQASTGLPVIGITPHGSKIARAESLTGIFEAGRVKIPERAHWLDEFLSEFCAFGCGSSRHDDQVDAVVLAITMAAQVGERAAQMRRGYPKLTGWMER
jgi:predicted phage terminase large subunit-like protein